MFAAARHDQRYGADPRQTSKEDVVLRDKDAARPDSGGV